MVREVVTALCIDARDDVFLVQNAPLDQLLAADPAPVTPPKSEAIPAPESTPDPTAEPEPAPAPEPIAENLQGLSALVTAEGLALFGYPPWAEYGAWAGLVAGILGIVSVQSTWRARRVLALPVSRVAGFTLTGLAAIVLSLFLYFWDLGPF